MKKILLIISLFVALSYSCNNDDEYELADAAPEFLLAASDVKKWELIDPKVELVVGSSMPVIKPAPPEGQVSNGLGYFYFIFLDKTIRFQDGYGVTSSDRTYETGTWEFNDSEKKSLTVTLNGNTAIWNLRKLTPSILEIEVNGTIQTFAPTPGTP